MLLTQEIKKALVSKYQASTLWTVDAIPFYLDHVPNSKNYPIICVYPISSNQTMSMPTVANPSGFDYSDGLWQITIFGNDRQFTQMEDIADRLETLYHRSTLPTGSGVTHIATFSVNQQQKFFDQNIKVWSIIIQFRIIVGR